MIRMKNSLMRLPFPALQQIRTGLVTLVLAMLMVALAPMVSARASVKIQEVTSSSGVKAWLVEDYSVPIIALRFAFKGGSVQDPAGKDGLAYLMSGLFDEGAGDLDRDAYQDRLDDSGAEISFTSGRDDISGSMRVIDSDLEEGVKLLAMAVQSPRFDKEPLERVRSQILTSLEARAKDPDAMSNIAWAKALYGNHPYALPDEGDVTTISKLTRDDLISQHKALLARSNLTVGVVGAIDAETLKKKLDEIFGGLPEKAELREIPEANLKLDQTVRVNYALPQTTIRLAYPGIKRDAPEFFAAYLMNQVLGGGTFSSRLFNEVREKRGLAYGIGSSLVSRDYSNTLAIGTSTRSDRASETLALVLNEVKQMAEKGPTEEELAAAKRYTIGAYAIANLDSSSSIAATLVGLQKENLGIDYIERREELINSVTLEQAKAEAKRLLSVAPAIMLVGPEETTPAEQTKAPEPAEVQ